MAIARVTEIKSSSTKSFDDARQPGRASREQDTPERKIGLDRGSRGPNR